MSSRPTRRSVLAGSVGVAFPHLFIPRYGWAASSSLGVGAIGVGGRGTDIGNQAAGHGKMIACADVHLGNANRFASQHKCEVYQDYRKLLERRDIDVITCGSTDHWHVKIALDAMKAGKDVYCEKPASYNIYEGLRMLETARQTKRMLQIGSQHRSVEYKIRAMQALHQGLIGKIYLAKGLCFKRRVSIGSKPDSPVPPGVNWDLFLGPAPMRPFNELRFRYNWHWFWDTGNGDIGNQGVHEMDICRWGMNLGLPKSVVSTGGKYVYDDDQETPNTQLATFDYGGAQIVFEVRGLLTGPEGGVPIKAGNTVGNLFFGADGWMWVDGGGFTIYKGESHEVALEEKRERGGDESVAHMRNFLAACRSRNYKDLTADVEIGAASADLCHLANISYRVGRKLNWDAARRRFNDAEADKLLTRDYRKPYVV